MAITVTPAMQAAQDLAAWCREEEGHTMLNGLICEKCVAHAIENLWNGRPVDART